MSTRMAIFDEDWMLKTVIIWEFDWFCLSELLFNCPSQKMTIVELNLLSFTIPFLFIEFALTIFNQFHWLWTSSLNWRLLFLIHNKRLLIQNVHNKINIFLIYPHEWVKKVTPIRLNDKNGGKAVQFLSFSIFGSH